MSDIAPKSVASRYLQRAVQSEEDSIVYNFISLPFISSFLVSGARKYASNYDLVHHTTQHTQWTAGRDNDLDSCFLTHPHGQI